jgi:hypothetical protein
VTPAEHAHVITQAVRNGVIICGALVAIGVLAFRALRSDWKSDGPKVRKRTKRRYEDHTDPTIHHRSADASSRNYKRAINRLKAANPFFPSIYPAYTLEGSLTNYLATPLALRNGDPTGLAPQPSESAFEGLYPARPHTEDK